MAQKTSSPEKPQTVLRNAFRAHKKDGESVRQILDDMDLFDYACKPFSDEVYLFLPLSRAPLKEERLKILNALSPTVSKIPQTSEKTEYFLCFFNDVSFALHKKPPTVSELLGFSPSYEIIGDIAVLDEKNDDVKMGDAGNEDAGNEDAGNEDAGNEDAGNEDAENEDAGNEDAENKDSGNEDAENKDSGNEDAGNEDAGKVQSPDYLKIAEAVLTAHSSVQTVLLSKGPISGEFRTRDLEFIAGVNKTKTVHKEYGCKYNVDLARAYFTPRLSTERHRILNQIESGATVIDMFAGVGPYSILIAKEGNPSLVIANDKNEAAVELLKKNIELNKVRNIIALNEDAAELSDSFAGAADHVLMNLPHNACDFLDTAVSLCNTGGVIHYYAMTSDDDLFDGSVALIQEAAAKQNRSIEVLEKKTVRSYAPHQYNICLDVKIL
ncbi:MAG: methyltransferase [Methanimicrococcus sp.]|nr:methyltransferase [Methanimicrococcus sp.]